ncbi:MAG: sugar phosphate isomerase/epimerase [Clostridia bacterium]|nr:sugar phosphate isomerase/epimerase [Clostridia bacterium]
MKIGVSSYSFNKYRRESGCSYADICRIAKEIGFDAIEFIGLDAKDPIAEAKNIRAVCAELGLEISAYTIGADLMKDDFDATRAQLHRDLAIAKALGAPLMRHDVCYSLPEGKSWQDAVAVMAPRIREITEYAESMGIRTCSENHGYIFQDSERVKALIDAVDHPNYRWLVDLGNFLCADEDPLSAVKVAAPYAIHVHAKDFLYKLRGDCVPPTGFFGTRGGNYLRGTIVGHGVVPVDACMAILKAQGYSGTLSLEFEGMEDNLPALKAGYAYLRAVAESLA